MGRGRRRGRRGREVGAGEARPAGSAPAAAGTRVDAGARSTGPRRPAAREVRPVTPDELDDRSVVRLGVILGFVLLGVGVLLLALAAAGRGWPYLLGAIDFLASGAVIVWAARHRRGVT